MRRVAALAVAYSLLLLHALPMYGQSLGGGIFGGVIRKSGGTMTGAFVPSQTAGITGTTTNNNADAGAVGEILTVTVASGSPVALTTNVVANIASQSLTAGDWDCTGTTSFIFAATTSYTALFQGLSTTSATLGAQGTFGSLVTAANVPTAANDMHLVVPTSRFSLSAPTTVYLVARGTFTVAALTSYGHMRCRRVR